MPFVQIPKVLNLDHRIWWAIFGLSQLLMIVLMIGSYFTTEWVELKSGVFKGSMLYLRELFGDTGNELYWHFYDKKSGCDGKDDVGMCKLIKDLYYGGVVFAFFEILSFLFLLIWVLYFLSIIMKCGCQCCCLHRPYCEAITALICHYIAAIVWLSYSHAEYKSDCKWDRKIKDVPTVCAKDGPNIALVLMIFFPIVVIVFIFVFQKAYHNLMTAREGRSNIVGQTGGYVPPPAFY